VSSTKFGESFTPEKCLAFLSSALEKGSPASLPSCGISTSYGADFQDDLLIGIGITGPNDPNVMVGERSVYAGHRNLRHVAGNAIFRAHTTSFAGFFAGRFDPGGSMACQALPVIGRRIVDKWFMRVVTRNAGQACVARTPAPAVLQAVRLKPHIGHAADTCLNDVTPGSVASPAEIDRNNGVQSARIQDRTSPFFDLSRLHGRDVFGTGTVASLAANSGC